MAKPVIATIPGKPQTKGQIMTVLNKPGKPGIPAPKKQIAPAVAARVAAKQAEEHNETLAAARASIAKPGAPVKKAAPVKPGAPVKKAPAVEAPAVHVPAAVTAREAALAAEIASMRDEMAKLTAAASKASRGPQPRTEAEIVKDAEKLFTDKNDWRLAYQGQSIWIYGFSRKDGKHGAALVRYRQDTPLLAFLAIPRDSDGRYGPQGRASGEIAAHTARNESGAFIGEPMFFTERELAHLWHNAKNGTAEDAEETSDTLTA